MERIEIETSSHPADAGDRFLRGLSLRETVRKLEIQKAKGILYEYKICV